MWRTTVSSQADFTLWDISIHVLRVEDDPQWQTTPRSTQISIHVLRVEDDALDLCNHFQHLISIHVLRVEDDLINFCAVNL